MIDPKLNEIPVEGKNTTAGRSLTEEEEKAERTARSRAGLSINDTIAAGANMSVGSRGVDTSGTRAGAGAGAGTTMLTPGVSGESPAPAVAPGARGSGTTPLGTSNQQPESTTLTSHQGNAASYQDEGVGEFTFEEISTRAHQCWFERGCPHGSPEVDWHRAVEQIRLERAQRSRTASV